jgi:threonylcarbamoyladenosine tRNA methylthiotransferase MtaB
MKNIYTFGCKVNQVESSEIEEKLFDYENENIIVVNTCTLTEKADAKCRTLINRLIRENSQNDKNIVITGCLVERDFESLLKKYEKNSNVIFVKNEDKSNIPALLNLKKNHINNVYKSDKSRAFLKIQDGCDSFCSYCIVPFVRNKKWSMPIDDIDFHVQKILANGFSEIVLTGVRIGFYEYVDSTEKCWKFEDVLQKLASNERIKRLRISSIEPTEITKNIINVIAKNKNICPHLHIAIQSGDDDILKSMKRGYDTNYLRDLFYELKSKIQDLRITVDLIIGYPSESDKNFENTLKLLDELQVDGIHVFPFSARKGTVAYGLDNKISTNEMNRRKNVLKNFDIKQRVKSLEKFCNSDLEVFFENEENSEYISGYTKNYIKVISNNFTFLQNNFVKMKFSSDAIDKTWPVFFRHSPDR